MLIPWTSTWPLLFEVPALCLLIFSSPPWALMALSKTARKSSWALKEEEATRNKPKPKKLSNMARMKLLQFLKNLPNAGRKAHESFFQIRDRKGAEASALPNGRGSDVGIERNFMAW